MSDGASGAFRAAMSGEPMPADAGANQPDVFADTGPVNFDDDGPSPSEQLRDVVEGAKPEPAPKSGEEGNIPSWRLRELREERDQERAELARVRKEADELRAWRKEQEEAAKPKPDIFGDPDTWERSLEERFERQFGEKLNPVQTQMQEFITHISKTNAEREFGKEEPAQAYKTVVELVQAGKIDGAALDAKLSKSFDPIGDIVREARRHKALSEIGDDPTAYREKLRQELLAELNANTAADAEPPERAAPRLVTEGPQPAARKPIPSLNRTAAAQGSDEPQGGAATLRSALRGG